jgi:hypothetical protein
MGVGCMMAFPVYGFWSFVVFFVFVRGQLLGPGIHQRNKRSETKRQRRNIEVART